MTRTGPRRPTRAPLLVLGVGLATCLSACGSTTSRDRDRAETPDDSRRVGLAAAASDASERPPEPARPWRPTDAVVSRAPWSFFGTDGETIETASYRIFTTERSGLLLERLPGFIEFALRHYRTSLTEHGPDPFVLPEPVEPMTTYLMDNRPQWERVTRALTGERAETYLRIPRGGYAFDGRGVYFDIGLSDTLNIAAHEGWHQYTQATFRAGLPVALEEGIATFMEGYRWDPERPSIPVFRPWSNPDRFDQLRNAHRDGRLLPLDRLIDSRPQDLLDTRGPGVLDYYAQVWALVHFLHEGENARYRDRLARLLRETASGEMPRAVLDQYPGRGTRIALANRRGDAVIRAYISPDLGQLSEEYRAFVDRLVRPGSRDAISAGRSPLASTP